MFSMPPASTTPASSEQDLLRAVDHRLDARAAQAVHGERRHLDRHAGLQADVARAVDARRRCSAARCRRPRDRSTRAGPGAFERRLRRDRAEVDRRHVLERADMGGHRRTRAAENENVFRHISVSHLNVNLLTLTHYVTVKQAHFIVFAMKSPTSRVPSEPPMSVVVWPAAIAASTAASIASASSVRAERLEHQRRGQDRADRIRHVLAGERRRRAVHRLEQRRPARDG